MLKADAELDATGLKCPMPVLRARRALKPMPVGAVLRVIADDPASLQDMPAFCETTGNPLIEATETADRFVFYIRKAG